jgi:hypothetical protein
VWVLNERLNYKSTEIKWYKYIKVDQVGDRLGNRVKGQVMKQGKTKLRFGMVPVVVT